VILQAAKSNVKTSTIAFAISPSGWYPFGEIAPFMGAVLCVIARRVVLEAIATGINLAFRVSLPLMQLGVPVSCRITKHVFIAGALARQGRESHPMKV
jgi:hypothetical protein